MKSSEKAIIIVVMLCHFTVAFTTLGLAPFFSVILQKTFGMKVSFWVGVFYVVPTLFTAFASPLWGRFADRFTKKVSLLRAQIGLAASFAIAGFAHSPVVFFIALVLQGIFGGTMSASNAYLATIVEGKTLSRCLTLMQASARSAFILAPMTFGLFMGLQSPIALYRYLSVLPLLAAIVFLCVSRHVVSHDVPHRCQKQTTTVSQTDQYGLGEIFILQFILAFATVITYPYFITFVSGFLPHLNDSVYGLLFGLPHVMYLMSAKKLSPIFERTDFRKSFLWAFVVLAITLALQAMIPNLTGFIIVRLLMGLAVTVCFIALHGMVSHSSTAKKAGKVFGWLDSSAKLAGVSSGLVAGALISLFQNNMPFYVGGASAIIGAIYLAIKQLPRPVCARSLTKKGVYDV